MEGLSCRDVQWGEFKRAFVEDTSLTSLLWYNTRRMLRKLTVNIGRLRLVVL